MKVLFVTAEAFPLAKTGGLADVSRALPMALAAHGIDVRILMPGYPQALTHLEDPGEITPLPDMLGVKGAGLLSGRLPDSAIPVSLILAPGLYQRPGSLYQDEDGQSWPDNARRFAYLSHAAAAVAMGDTPMKWTPDIVHANDWHAGLLPLLLQEKPAPRPHTIFTVHNMAFQGNFAAETQCQMGIDPGYYTSGKIEFYGWLSYLKAGLSFADHVTTVSPNYAREILTEEFGCGMEGVLQGRGAHFCGILNGIDSTIWDPQIDADIIAPYSEDTIAGKRQCKAALQAETGLAISPSTPLIGFVSRLTEQKMADVVAESIPWMADQGAQFVLVGQGDAQIENTLRAMAAAYPDQIHLHIGYGEPLAHRLQAGSDILLAPARFEPCGLTQLYGLRYGTLPVVRKTGGLADTVTDANEYTTRNNTATGFVFDAPTLEGLTGAMTRALRLFHEPLRWRRLQRTAMAQDFSWDSSATRYIALYQAVCGAPVSKPARRLAPSPQAQPLAGVENPRQSTG